MARIGGRSTAVAWVFGILCAAVVVGLLYLAAPMVPVIGQLIGGTIGSLAG